MELKLMEFKYKVYALVKKIPKRRITTYKILAQKLKSSTRAIGQILKRNTSKDVPCHRVVMSNGFVGGYHGKNGLTKIRMLKKEGIKIKNNQIQDFKKVLFYLD